LARAVEPFLQDGDLARIARPVDWFGLNHYSPLYVRAAADKSLGFASADPPAGTPRTGIGWPIEPDAFRTTLLDTHARYRLPIYVTENGFGGLETADDRGEVADHDRVAYLASYGDAMDAAIASGADVRGYFVWSLLDNFEWRSGYGPRFGIVHVDYPTQRRTPKASFHWYADRIRQAASQDGE
jgi:beta-glucosidase